MRDLFVLPDTAEAVIEVVITVVTGDVRCLQHIQFVFFTRRNVFQEMKSFAAFSSGGWFMVGWLE